MKQRTNVHPYNVALTPAPGRPSEFARVSVASQDCGADRRGVGAHDIRCLFAAAFVLLSATAALAGGDPVAGAAVFRKCGACHTATAPENRVGPSLMGVVGRRVATAPGYSYSPAMTAFGADGKVWDEALLRKYLPSPQFLVKGTRMTFPGLKSDKDIDNVIAYLKNPAAAQ